MYSKKISLKNQYRNALLLALALLLAVNSIASAHIFVLKPDAMTVKRGAELSFTAGLAEPLITLDMSRSMLEAMRFTIDMDASVKYKSGTVTDIPLSSFKPVNPSMPLASADAEVARFSVEEKGTAVLFGSFTMKRDGKTTACFTKSFINLTNDGMSTQVFAGEKQSVAEIVFTDNVKSVKRGDALKVRVLLKGKPLTGANVSATYDGAPLKKADAPENEYLTVKTNVSGEAAFAIDRAGLWICSIEYENPLDKIRYRSSVLFEVH